MGVLPITKSELENWLTKSKLIPKEIVKDEFEFFFEIQRGKVIMLLTKRCKEDFIQIQTIAEIKDEKLMELYTPENDRIVKAQILDQYPSLNVDLNYMDGPKIKIYDTIFADGFSFDRLSRSLRTVTLTVLWLWTLFHRSVGEPLPEQQPDLTYYG